MTMPLVVLQTSDNSDLEHNANLSPIYADSDAPYESVRSQDLNHGAEDFELDGCIMRMWFYTALVDLLLVK